MASTLISARQECPGSHENSDRYADRAGRRSLQALGKRSLETRKIARLRARDLAIIGKYVP